MKKSLIALAIMGGMSGAAMAQSTVSVYGVVDLGLQHSKSGDSKVTGIDSGLQSGSRLGFKGTEDLGNGLKANFVLESGINADTGTYGQGNTAFGRQAWLGLEGDFGAVKLGRQYTPIRNALLAVDPFALASAGSLSRIAMNGQVGEIERVNNSVVYELGKNSLGLTGAVQYGFGESPDSMSKDHSVGFAVGYKYNALDLGVAYNERDIDSLAKQKSTALTGVYDFGVAKAHAAFGEEKLSINGAQDIKARTYMVGVSAPVGAVGTVKASYVINDQRTFQDADSKQFAVGYDHALSKRTNLYATVAHVSNDDNAALGGASAAGKNVSTYQIGMRHTF